METKKVKLVYGDSEIEIMCDETILEGAYRNGLKLKYHCAAGHCGRCKMQVVSGEARIDHSGGISRTDISAGYILTCCSYALENIEVK